MPLCIGGLGEDSNYCLAIVVVLVLPVVYIDYRTKINMISAVIKQHSALVNSSIIRSPNQTAGPRRHNIECK